MRTLLVLALTFLVTTMVFGMTEQQQCNAIQMKAAQMKSQLPKQITPYEALIDVRADCNAKIIAYAKMVTASSLAIKVKKNELQSMLTKEICTTEARYLVDMGWTLVTVIYGIDGEKGAIIGVNRKSCEMAMRGVSI